LNGADILSVPSLAVVTPANSAAIPYLRESAAGIREALLCAPEWEIDWRIELDGVDIDLVVSEELAVELSQLLEGVNCQSVQVADHGFQAGGAITRSIAFFDEKFPKCEWTMSLDADDILLPGALRVMFEAVSANPDIYYVAGGVIKEAPSLALGESPTVHDEEETNWNGPLPPGMHDVHPEDWRYLKPLIRGGRVPAGGILDFMEENRRFPIFAACACYKTKAIADLGGWPGTPTGADAALLAFVSEQHPGWVAEEPFVAYRQHAAQNTRSAWFLRNRDVTWRMVKAATGRPGISGGM